MKLSHALHHRSVWSLRELSRADLLTLLDTAGRLKSAARAGKASVPLRGKNLALLGDDAAAASHDALRRAALDLGAKVADLRSNDARIGNGTLDSARMLGRLYDAVDCTAMTPALVAQVDRDAGIPVFNGLGADDHSTRVLAELLGMQEYSGKPLADLSVCFVGDPDTPCGDALLQAAALTGMDLRVAAPRNRWPGRERMHEIERLAESSAARVRLFESRAEAAAGADFVLEADSRKRWHIANDKASIGDTERADNRRFIMQALLVNTMA